MNIKSMKLFKYFINIRIIALSPNKKLKRMGSCLSVKKNKYDEENRKKSDLPSPLQLDEEAQKKYSEILESLKKNNS